MKPEEDWHRHFHADGRLKDPRETLIRFALAALAVIFVGTIVLALVILTR